MLYNYRRINLTSDSVRELVLSFFSRASAIADTASLAFVAKGTKTNATKKEDRFAEEEKSRTLPMSGSARRPSITIPRSSRAIAFPHARGDLSMNLSSISLSVCSHVFCFARNS